MKKDSKNIEEVLAKAYHNRQGPEPGEAWELSVMRSIRKMPDVSERVRWSRLIGRLFWELCPAACAIIIFLAAASYRLNLVPEQDFAQFVASDDGIEMVLPDPNG